MKNNIIFLIVFIALSLDLSAQNNNKNDNLTEIDNSLRNTVTVDCEHVSLPIIETFDDLADCWQYFSDDPNNNNNSVLGPCLDGENYVFRFSSMIHVNSGNYVQYLITPELPTGASSISISLDAKSLYESQSLQLGYSTTTDDIASFTWLSATSVPVSGGVCSETFPAGTTFIAIKYASADKFYLYIDNLTIANAEEDCSEAVSVLPWTEDFSSGCFPPECWDIDFTNIDTTWKLFYLNGTWASCSGTSYDRTEKLITRTLDFSNYEEVHFDFNFMSNYSYVDNDYIDLKIFASTNGGETFDETPLWKLSDFGVFENWTSTPVTIDLSNLAGENNVKLSFVYEGSLAQVTFSDVRIYDPGQSAVADVLDLGMQIYPNPAQNMITIKSMDYINHIEIFTISGQKVADMNSNGNSVEMSISHLAAGMYVMRIRTSQGTATRKFSISR